ncbi:hypothetical protein IVB02_25955 [Bradyrhizobium sp. 166]|uniref:hypothetical protein n=1 Tax=Bradyrhizobium sp. 166 TaxID=2782638 RepID=UPI001FFBF64B|nr:hypothetical protein [Bradyrhizobium sp. 166]MCK1604753.1 hypothetical protein [Bradyrhizobium sp. 166]
MSEARDEFCRAIDEGDVKVAMATLVGVMSADESMHTDTDPNFDNAIKHLVDWLMQCGCIEDVALSSGILKSQPPLKMLTLTTRPLGTGRIFHLKLQLGSRMEIRALEG